MLRNCVRSRAEQLEEKRAIKKKFREMAERGADRERNSPLIRSHNNTAGFSLISSSLFEKSIARTHFESSQKLGTLREERVDDNSFAIRGRRKATPPVASSTNKRKPGANIDTCTNVGRKKFGGEKLYSHLGLMAFVVLKSFGSGRRGISRMWKNRYCSFSVLFIWLAFRGSIRKKR